MATLFRCQLGDEGRVDYEVEENIQPEDGESFHLAELYSMLECDLVEVVDLYDGRILICDEEGKLKAHVANPVPSKLYRALGGDYIAGSALLCKADQFR